MGVSLLRGTCFILFISLMVNAAGPSTYVVFMLRNLSALWESCLLGESSLPSGLLQNSPLTSGLLNLCSCSLSLVKISMALDPWKSFLHSIFF